MWTFSLELYAREGVAGQCLDLQDRLGVDVNLLLYAVFAATRGVEVSAADLAAVEAGIAEFRDQVLRPQRALRRRLDKQGDGVDARQAMLDAELALERLQQDRMWQARRPSGEWASGAGAMPLRGNLGALAAHSKISEAELEDFALTLEHLLPLLLAEL